MKNLNNVPRAGILNRSYRKVASPVTIQPRVFRPQVLLIVKSDIYKHNIFAKVHTFTFYQLYYVKHRIKKAGNPVKQL